ncbi:hypothetical protein BOTBODRAFT_179340 [Botryobasidium botryosum FD-172 SS1]|uniref:Uncharacterized protein n=1 Tax=Botryobasidium botryosum (strain FD-172 SS1) TaxID=930990 RepID=A0A067MBN4_BOTB1|nr:hypothetical protein BOTBODRAFT_179340 [Botryobasidium botryosum FD-172 SS1]
MTAATAATPAQPRSMLAPCFPMLCFTFLFKVFQLPLCLPHVVVLYHYFFYAWHKLITLLRTASPQGQKRPHLLAPGTPAMVTAPESVSMDTPTPSLSPPCLGPVAQPAAGPAPAPAPSLLLAFLSRSLHQSSVLRLPPPSAGAPPPRLQLNIPIPAQQPLFGRVRPVHGDLLHIFTGWQARTSFSILGDEKYSLFNSMPLWPRTLSLRYFRMSNLYYHIAVNPVPASLSASFALLSALVTLFHVLSLLCTTI